MSKYVLDASALLALFNKEDGYKRVADVVTHSVMSAVNVSEVIKILQKNHVEGSVARHLITDVLGEIIPFDEKQAYTAAILDQTTSKLGLSLGDRACLSLAQHLNAQILTADKIWSKLKFSVSIEVIR